MTRVVFTGGGSAGHVTPNVALIEAASERGWTVRYIGSHAGIERDIIAPLDIPYTAISSGKLRRYFSWENFIDPFRILWGMLQSLVSLVRDRPDAVFSKGGFVSVPVAIAAWLLRIPVISHESDVTPGLANRLIAPFCRALCVTFRETAPHLPSGKVVVTGTPVRQALLNGDRQRGLAYLGFTGNKPVLLVFGGSLGADAINQAVRGVLDQLLPRFDVIHVVGRGHEEPGLATEGYVQKTFISDEFGDVMAAADLVIARAGANSLYELFLLHKPHLLVPLTLAASRGDQLANARTFAAQGYSQVIHEEELVSDNLVKAVDGLFENRENVIRAMAAFDQADSTPLILEQIEQAIG